MAGFCLTKDQENNLRDAFVSGKLGPFKLSQMPSSEVRRAKLEEFIDVENAANVNSLFESKLLLKNQIIGFQTWVKSLIGVTPKIKRDLLTKIDRLNEIGVLNPADLKAFQEDLVRTRLGFGVTFEEAKTINELSAQRVESKEIWEEKIKENPEWADDPYATRKEWRNDSKRFDYGLKQVALENFVNDLRTDARNKRVSFREQPVRAVSNAIKDSPGFLNNLAKSLMASIDNSFFGRQGIKNLYGNRAQKAIWGRNFAKSFSDIAAELRRKKIRGVRPADFVKADIYSRPNAVNGKYKAGNYRLDVLHEEAIPTSLPEKIPVFGRFFSAAEVAFGGGALRMRADLADMLISQMDAQGINTLNSKNAIPAGNFVGSLTGRGNLGRLTPLADKLNLLLWSARFFKSNVETVFAPAKFAATKAGLRTPSSEGAAFIEKKAAQNMVSIVAHVAGIMMMAKFLDPESVEEDPRGTNFGRVKIFGHWTDMTGGMRAIAIMSARLVPTFRDGKWGFWSKTSTGKWTNLRAGEFGKDDPVDVLMDTLLLNRLSPIASVLSDFYKGEMFGGEPFDIKKSIVNSAIPLSIQNVNDVKDEGFAAVLAVGIAEFFGLGVSTYKFQTNWQRSTSKEMTKFKEQVGEETFKDANDSYNRAYNAWVDSVQEDSKYKELSEEGKKKLESQARSAIKKRILDEFGFDDTKEPETVEQLREKEKIKSLKPISNLIESILDLTSSEAKAAGLEGIENIIDLELKGDRLETTYIDSEGLTRTISKSINDLSLKQRLGQLADKIGTALNFEERGISEQLGFESREQLQQRIKEFKDSSVVGSVKILEPEITPEPTPEPVEQPPLTKVAEQTTVQYTDLVAENFPANEVNNALNIMAGESSGNPNATNTNNNGSVDYGLMQINDIHRSVIKNNFGYTMQDMFDPDKNLQVARFLYNQSLKEHGNGWIPWVAAKKLGLVI